MVVDIAGVRQGVSELLQAVYIQYKARRYLMRFCLHFEFKFWFPQFGERGPRWGWAYVVSDGASVTSYRSHYKTIKCLWFCRCV